MSEVLRCDICGALGHMPSVIGWKRVEDVTGYSMRALCDPAIEHVCGVCWSMMVEVSSRSEPGGPVSR